MDISQDTKLIPLTQGKFAIVDAEDYDHLMQWKWYVNKRRNISYAVRDIVVDGKKKSIWMHRLINDTPEHLLTDHINGEGLDNRKANLRSVTHQENMINCGRWKKGGSKYRGVSWHKSNKCWIAQITVNCKNTWIGSYKTELEAKTAYDVKRAEVRKNQITRGD